MNTQLKTLGLIGLAVMSFSVYVFAEDVPQGNVQNRVAQLRSLKEQNPTAFREQMSQRKAHVKEKL